MPEVSIDSPNREFVISRLNATKDAWYVGRAGMQYRDLIPGRLGGRFIASHIRITHDGETQDYVHYHKALFQVIYCKTGWARLVYEDQGPPFLLEAGDCALQPPEIRHRVLESSAGLEVIEVACPAEYETRADHEMRLPTRELLPERLFGGARREIQFEDYGNGRQACGRVFVSIYSARQAQYRQQGARESSIAGRR